MRKITILQNKKFITECEKLIKANYGLSVGENRFEIKGRKDNLYISLFDNTKSQLYSVFCRFDKCNVLTGNMNSKHNLHVSGAIFSTLDAVELFGKHLTECLAQINYITVE